MKSLLFIGGVLLAAATFGTAWPTHSSWQYGAAETAQTHCPNDTVVWLNLYSGIYHYAGARYYGNTSRGAYVCKQDADKAGDRASRNGS